MKKQHPLHRMPVGEYTPWSGTIRLNGTDLRVFTMKDTTRMVAEQDFHRLFHIEGTLKQRPGHGLPNYLLELQPVLTVRAYGLLSHVRRPLSKVNGGRGLRSLNAQAIPQLAQELYRIDGMGDLPEDLLGCLQPAGAAINLLDINLDHTFPNTGINRMIDDTTGYAPVRRERELHRIIEGTYDGKPLGSWLKELPEEWWTSLFRLRGWNWDDLGIRHLDSPRSLDFTIRQTLLANLPEPFDHTIQSVGPYHIGGDGMDEFQRHAQQQIGMMRCYTSWNGYRQRDHADTGRKPSEGAL